MLSCPGLGSSLTWVRASPARLASGQVQLQLADLRPVNKALVDRISHILLLSCGGCFGCIACFGYACLVCSHLRHNLVVYAHLATNKEGMPSKSAVLACLHLRRLSPD
jgi:hypothetical protein